MDVVGCDGQPVRVGAERDGHFVRGDEIRDQVAMELRCRGGSEAKNVSGFGHSSCGGSIDFELRSLQRRTDLALVAFAGIEDVEAQDTSEIAGACGGRQDVFDGKGLDHGRRRAAPWSVLPSLPVNGRVEAHSHISPDQELVHRHTSVRPVGPAAMSFTKSSVERQSVEDRCFRKRCGIDDGELRVCPLATFHEPEC